MDVADWLRALSLERYAAAFRRNDVDDQLLSKLTDYDLKELGVTSLGHRRRLLEAIAALRLKDTPVDGLARLSASPTGNVDSPEITAERRPLSVMFCDLVGSTALSSRLDPEDLRDVIRTYQACVATTIRQFDGFIARYVGDGVLTYFGWPEARETDAERAVRAGLAVAAAVSRAPLGGEALQVRVGIATGLVVVGEPIGSGDSRQQTAIGETPNLAARLHGLAGPGHTVIDAATRRQIGGLFECRDLGTVELKGLPVAVPAWQVLGEGMLESRFEALHGNAVMPLIGREEEIELLLRRWQQAVAGEGRVVLLTGEPGIGKSRLLAELEKRLATETHASLRYFCSPLHQSSALHPITARWEQNAGFARGDPAEQRLRKLESLLASDELSPPDIALLAGMLGVPTGERYPQLDLSPHRRKERTFALLQRLLASLAQRQPVLMLFEDAHWADHSSLELLDTVVSQIAELPVLLVISFRPEFVPPWIGRTGVSLITLARLDQRQSAALAAQVTTAHALTQSILERIIKQTDGVPLFIEELTKTILETEPDVAPLVLTVPSTLQASLMARLDRLPAARQVAQIGAVIGREFSLEVISAVARMPDTQLVQGINELIISGLVFRRGPPSETSYIFKHALIQDVAYESLLRGRRADIHARVVEVLERDADGAASTLALLGYHCAEGGLTAKAAGYFRQAGDLLFERAAFAETRTQLDRGLALVAKLPHSAVQGRLEIELLLGLASILTITRGVADIETAAALDRAIRLSRSLGDDDSLGLALAQRIYGLIRQGDLDAAWQNALELKDTVGEAAPGRPAAHVFTGHILFARGRFAEARVEIDTISRITLSEPVATRFDVIAAELELPLSTLNLACLGWLDQASAAAARFSARAGKQRPFAQAMGLSYLCRYEYLVNQNIHAVQQLSGSLAVIAQEHLLSESLYESRLYQAVLDLRAGHVERGLLELVALKAATDAESLRGAASYHYCVVADALASAGRIAEALATLRAGADRLSQTNLNWASAELYRRLGELCSIGSKPDLLQAEHELIKAIDIAREQSAKLFELRASVSLARLWSEQGGRWKASSLLTPIYDWFTEGLESNDLRQARQLLTDLSAV
jgi:class 3 adenylate cyclase